jgi:hypothetical protein
MLIKSEENNIHGEEKRIQDSMLRENTELAQLSFGLCDPNHFQDLGTSSLSCPSRSQMDLSKNTAWTLKSERLGQRPLLGLSLSTEASGLRVEDSVSPGVRMGDCTGLSGYWEGNVDPELMVNSVPVT